MIKDKTFRILLNALPIILMISLIPLFRNDYALTIIYAAIIAVAFAVRHEKRDIGFFIFGFIIMTLSELAFVSTGVETFTRNSLFNIMPLWLPFLWAYAFVVIKRAIVILLNAV